MRKQTKKILVTGVSSGIGRTLVGVLIAQGKEVWGVARRKNLLLSLEKELKNNHLFTSSQDISSEKGWSKLLKQLTKAKFIPDIIVFNAGIWEKDLEKSFNIRSTQRMIDTNFYGVIRGIFVLLPVVKLGTQFIVISSLSAFKGSANEGVGYAASKAAISIAFESLYQKYKTKFIFKTIFFGPIDKKLPLISIGKLEAANFIVNSFESKNSIFYKPVFLFFFYKCLKFLPSGLYFWTLQKSEILKEKLYSNH